ncbi:MAG: hypothetical protein PVI92_08355 [Chromatiales bacterium]|jgi:hypothetical protein
MAVKKTVKGTVKKRRKARKVVPVESVISSLQENAPLSAVNSRTLSRIKQADTAVAKIEKQVEAAAGRVSKAVESVAKAKTAAAKANAKERVATARAGLKEVKASLAQATSEQKKALRLGKALNKSIQSAQAKMAKEYDKMAKAAEKAAEKTTRRRRTRKKRAVIS